MKRIITLFFALLIIPYISTFSQGVQGTITLQVDRTLASLNLGDVLVNKNLKDQARFFQLLINTTPAGSRIIVEGTVEWREGLSGDYKRLYTFKSNIFTARNLSSNNIGDPDIGADQDITDNDLRDELAKKGKPSGALKFSVRLFAENNPDELSHDEYILELTNPAPTLTVSEPLDNSSVDIGNVQVSWSPVQGVNKYEIQAGKGENYEDALTGGTLTVDIKNIDKNTTAYSINQTNLSKDWVPGSKYFLIVKAYYTESGGEKDITSVPVQFTISQTSQTNNNSGTTGNNQQPDPTLVELATVLGNNLDPNVLALFNNGTIKIEQLQFEDENGQSISMESFLQLLNMLKTLDPANVTITYIPN